MAHLTVHDLKSMIDKDDDLQIIDIREEHELMICSIKGIHIPMGEIMDRRNELRRDCPVVIHCRSGKRSAAVVHLLERKHHFTNVFTLQGGIMAWAEEIDPSLPTY